MGKSLKCKLSSHEEINEKQFQKTTQVNEQLFVSSKSRITSKQKHERPISGIKTSMLQFGNLLLILTVYAT